MTARYIFRLDDITPTMHWDVFAELQTIFDTYGVCPIMGIVPDNQDPKLMVQPARADFWDQVRDWDRRGWVIAQHGYKHEYTSQNSGIIGHNQYSEFAGLWYAEQKSKIHTGQHILQTELGHPVTWWMAPAHSFDTTTCQVLREEGFTHITDGHGIFPFQKHGLTWIPQQLWSPKKRPFGVWTICLHINHYDQKMIENIRLFCQQEQKNIVHPTSLTTGGVMTDWVNRLYGIVFQAQQTLYRWVYKKSV